MEKNKCMALLADPIISFFVIQIKYYKTVFHSRRPQLSPKIIIKNSTFSYAKFLNTVGDEKHIISVTKLASAGLNVYFRLSAHMRT